MKSDTIIVTGGAGFIGSHVIASLLPSGCKVVNLDCLTYAGNLASVEHEGEDNYHFEKVDIRDKDAVKDVFERYQPTAIMHLAAESHVDRSIDSPGDFITSNVIGTFVLLDVALDYYKTQKPANFRFHHISTDEVFGSLGETGFFSETTAYDPRSPYSASKASSDHLVRAWGETFGLPIVITNCSNNYGPNQFPEKLIPVIILKCLSENTIPVYGDGSNVRDWLYVVDHAEALIKVVNEGEVGETYCIGGNNELTNLEVVHTICKIMDQKQPRSSGASYKELIEFVTDRPGHDQRYAIDASKIKKELSWEPKETVDSGFEKTVSWYLENRSWWEAILNGSYKLDRLGVEK